MALDIRQLQDSDGETLWPFLSRYAETSMFLRGNMKLAGLSYQGERYQGEYFAAFDGTGVLLAVLVHFWNGNIMMQGPDQKVLHDLTVAFRARATRPVAGILGAGQQVDTVIASLDLIDAEYATNDTGGLYAVELENLVIPHTKTDETELTVKLASKVEREILIQWMKDYEIESLGAEDSKTLSDTVTDRVDRMKDETNCWALFHGDNAVSLSGFNSRLPDIVQIGPVWTPPAHRNQGYARYLVAKTLEQAKQSGVKKSILFTSTPSAIRAYEAIGFIQIDTFRLALLKKPVAI